MMPAEVVARLRPRGEVHDARGHDLRNRPPLTLIQELTRSGEELFFELALDDLTRAADLVSTDLGPDGRRGRLGVVGNIAALAHDTARTLAAARALHARAGRPNLSSRSPAPSADEHRGDRADLWLKSRGHAPLDPAQEGVSRSEVVLVGEEKRHVDRNAGEDRLLDGRQPFLGDAAVTGRVPEALRNQLGIAIAKRTYKVYRSLLGCPRWQRVFT
jgi:transaldolase